MDKPPASQPPQPSPIPTPITTPQPTQITSSVLISPPSQPIPQQAPFALDWLIRQKPCLLIISLRSGGEQNISNLAKKSGMSYVHAIELMKLLEGKGIITTELRGNKRMARLTEGGAAFASALEELVKKTPTKK